MSALLDATLLRLGGDDERTYALNDVPTKPVYPYRVVSVSPADAFGRTASGEHHRMRRAVVQSFSQSLSGALAFDEGATDLLDGHFLVAAGYDCGPCRLELSSAVTRDSNDNGVVGVTTTFIFPATKEA